VFFQIEVVEKTKTHILCSVTFSRKSCRLWDNVEKYGTAGQTTDGNIIRRMRFACWITKATDTLRIFNTYCFRTATVVTRTCLNVTFILALPVLFLLHFPGWPLTIFSVQGVTVTWVPPAAPIPSVLIRTKCHYLERRFCCLRLTNIRRTKGGCSTSNREVLLPTFPNFNSASPLAANLSYINFRKAAVGFVYFFPYLSTPLHVLDSVNVWVIFCKNICPHNEWSFVSTHQCLQDCSILLGFFKFFCMNYCGFHRIRELFKRHAECYN
jgi:hypothetical protein